MPDTAVKEPKNAHASCIHRWMIETPNGETSKGTCTACGATKLFPNSAEDGLWEREVPVSRWTGRADGAPRSY